MGDDSGELVDKFHKWTEKVVKRLKLTFTGQELKPFLDKKYYESSFNQKEKKIVSDVIQKENLSVHLWNLSTSSPESSPKVRGRSGVLPNSMKQSTKK